ncbi:SIMPL domain-containing protein [Flavobacterium terrisoli]|uniref:SIMPL domain-containing protein n=1 Tax=Flavobacterium terrisoli TaxID=3242195 RepID=UPI002542D904|nr:SIMPL domain-containing protein [Flavobacterium buctense]
MKTYFLLILALVFWNSNAQTIDSRKYIEVTASAEMSVQPDEIELEIVLMEYDLSGKKVKLDDIQDKFYKALKDNHIDTKTLALESTDNSWYWWYWWNYRHEHYRTKTIKLKLNNQTNFLKLVEDLNEKWTQSIRISKTTHQEIQRLRKEVKIEAMKAAKAKATYLLESVDEKIGHLLAVEEMPEATTNYNNFWYGRQNLLSNVSNSVVSNSSSDPDSGIDNVGAIKLRYEIKAKYEIQ